MIFQKIKQILLSKIIQKQYAKKIDKEGKINWSEDAEKIIGKINGLFPTPGLFLFLKEKDTKY